ncbi:MAG: V4R domain-containing protein [Bacteroidota bacterium]
METNPKYNFQWKDLGDIDLGRPNLGTTTHVLVYRLMQYTMRDVLEKHCGAEKTNEFFVESGFKAGLEFCKNVMDCSLDFDGFIADLSSKMEKFGIGILRVEKADMGAMNFLLTVSEDLDCSGLPYSGVAFCDYDEGFIAGIMHGYTGKDFKVKEVDCWGTGERTCRFSVVMTTR